MAVDPLRVQSSIGVQTTQMNNEELLRQILDSL